MKIVAFVPFESDDIEFGLLEQDLINGIEDPFAGGGIVRNGRTYSRENVVLVNPAFPSKALCIGLNYMDHAKEFGLPVPQTPVVRRTDTACGRNIPCRTALPRQN